MWAFIFLIVFGGGIFVGTQIIKRLNSDDLTKLADDYESNLERVREQYRATIKLLEQSNQHSADSIAELERTHADDTQRIGELESTVERLQAPIGESLNEIGGIEDTVQRIKEATSGIGRDVQGLRKEVQRLQTSK
jgi:methyl-accepting chemotaxis protein